MLHFSTWQTLVKFNSGQRSSREWQKQRGIHHQMLEVGRLHLILDKKINKMIIKLLKKFCNANSHSRLTGTRSKSTTGKRRVYSSDFLTDSYFFFEIQFYNTPTVMFTLETSVIEHSTFKIVILLWLHIQIVNRTNSSKSHLCLSVLIFKHVQENLIFLLSKTNLCYV